MTQNSRRPLVLVVDDVADFRERLLPSLAKEIGCRVCKAGTVQEALCQAANHSPESGDPLDLIILDMHLPIAADRATEIVEDGGIRFLQEYTFTKCPIVVFTAYPLFRNCVAAILAGATAYIPKGRQGGEGGPDALRETCELLLGRPEHKQEKVPTREWIAKHHEWLTAEFRGKWVAFIPKAAARDSAILKESERDGVILLVGDSYKEVRAKLLAFPAVLMSFPALLMVQ